MARETFVYFFLAIVFIHTSSFQNRRMGPGSYYVDVGGFNRKSVDERASGPGWARAYEVERMAALPHLLHKDQWELKKMLVGILPHLQLNLRLYYSLFNQFLSFVVRCGYRYMSYMQLP